MQRSPKFDNVPKEEGMAYNQLPSRIVYKRCELVDLLVHLWCASHHALCMHPLAWEQAASSCLCCLHKPPCSGQQPRCHQGRGVRGRQMAAQINVMLDNTPGQETGVCSFASIHRPCLSIFLPLPTFPKRSYILLPLLSVCLLHIQQAAPIITRMGQSQVSAPLVPGNIKQNTLCSQPSNIGAFKQKRKSRTRYSICRSRR